MLAEFRARAFSADIHEKFDKNVASFCSSIQKENVNNLSNLLAEYQAMRMPLFGYLFRGSQVAALNTKAQQLATFSKQVDFKKDGQLIQNLLSQCRALISWIDEFGEPQVSFELAYSHLAKKHLQS